MAELLLTNKGKLKWRGEFESLQIFLEKDLNIKGKWTSASGAKLLKTDDIQIRWYSQQETITLNGPKAEEYKSLLEAKASVLDITVSDISQKVWTRRCLKLPSKRFQ